MDLITQVRNILFYDIRQFRFIFDDQPTPQEQPDMSKNTYGAEPPSAPLTLERASSADVAALAEESVRAGEAIGVLDIMLGELADQFATFRKHTQDEAMISRRDIEANKARVHALEATVSKQADAWRAALTASAQTHQARDNEIATLRAQVAQLEGMVANAAREAAKPKADPLEAFRARLK